MTPVLLIEVLFIGGAVLAFTAWELWQLRDRKDQKKPPTPEDEK